MLSGRGNFTKVCAVRRFAAEFKINIYRTMCLKYQILQVQVGAQTCCDFLTNIILLPVQFGSNRFQTGSEYLRNLRTENRTEQRSERTRTEQNRTFGSVLSVLVLWISSELNFGNTNDGVDERKEDSSET